MYYIVLSQIEEVTHLQMFEFFLVYLIYIDVHLQSVFITINSFMEQKNSLLLRSDQCD